MSPQLSKSPEPKDSKWTREGGKQTDNKPNMDKLTYKQQTTNQEPTNKQSKQITWA